MERPKIPQQYAASQDWFHKAMASDKSVTASLQEVVNELGERSKFVTSLMEAICRKSTSEFDAITDLLIQTRLLKNTLDVRLGVLREDRIGGWFREAMFENSGPFQTKTLKDPVFCRYPNEKYPKIREQIQKAWRNGAELDAAYMAPGSCLWRILLNFNRSFQAISLVQINETTTLNLNAIPHELPDYLDSPLLRQFLLNVATQLSKLRTALNECYSMLWKSSMQLWRVQMESFSDAGFEKNSSTRDYFRERRQEQQRYRVEVSTFRALKFMGFLAMPTAEELRSKYLLLAKKYHPDIEGGDEDRFKELSEAYRVLSQSLSTNL